MSEEVDHLVSYIAASPSAGDPIAGRVAVARSSTNGRTHQRRRAKAR